MNSILLTISVMQIRAQHFFDDAMSFDNVIKSWGAARTLITKTTHHSNMESIKSSEFRHEQIQNPGDIYQPANNKQT